MVGEREPKTSTWSVVRRFHDAGAAREAYEQTRDLILLDGVAASVFRFTVSQDSFVAVLGNTLPEARALEHINELLDKGEPAKISDEILGHLQGRRQAFNAMPIEFLERRQQDEREIDS